MNHEVGEVLAFQIASILQDAIQSGALPVGLDRDGVAKALVTHRADARALWAVRVLDRLGRRLVKQHGCYASGVTPGVPQLSSGAFTCQWWGCGNQPLGETEDAARIAAAEALVAEDPALGEGL